MGRKGRSRSYLGTSGEQVAKENGNLTGTSVAAAPRQDPWSLQQLMPGLPPRQPVSYPVALEGDWPTQGPWSKGLG